DSLALQGFDDLAPTGARSTWNGEEDFVDIGVLEQLSQAVGSEDGHTVEPKSVKSQIVVDEAHEMNVRFVAQGEGQLLTCAPCAIDEHTANICIDHLEQIEQREAHENPARGQQQQENDWMQGAERSRHIGNAQ